MTAPRPSALRHRPPAVLLAEVARAEADHLEATGVDEAAWPWPRLLEGAAQAAGLLVGTQPHGLRNTAVVAEYRRVVVHAPAHRGAVRFVAAIDRRILRSWRCAITAHDAGGRTLLSGLVTLAPPAGGTAA